MRDPLPDHASVAVFGLGAAGHGACRLLHALGKRVIASDSRPEAVVDLPAEVEVRLGTNSLGDASAVVLSPGLNPEWPENRDNAQLADLWRRWRAGEIAIISEVDLAAAALNRPWIAVGGTDGKSTTAALCAELGRAVGARTILGGNSWTAMSEVVARERDCDLAVIEVSAFQSWRPHTMHPRVSVLTNIAPDHLDHYASDADYARAKLHIHEHLGPGDTAVLYGGDARLTATAPALRERGVRVCWFFDAPPTSASRLDSDAYAWVEGNALFAELEAGQPASRFDGATLRTPGAHNRRNALAALMAVTSALDSSTRVDGAALSTGLAAFRGLPHRLEFVRELHGVRWFDDSKATNVHAACVGLCALAAPLVAIVGGVDKQLDLSPLREALLHRARHVVTIGEAAARIERELDGAAPFTRAGSMQQAVDVARSVSLRGDSVVLSPGCSSFDMFRSFEHRGEVYQAAVRALGDGAVSLRGG